MAKNSTAPISGPGVIIRSALQLTRDPAARTYTDIALTPVTDDEEMTLNLFTNTSALAPG